MPRFLPQPFSARRMTRRLLTIIAIFSVLFAGAPLAPAALAQSALSADDVNEQLGIGVNLGNALEAPREGDWGMTIEAGFFPLIADAGFRHVRVPIKFSQYAAASAPYTISSGNDPNVANAANLWERIDWIIAQAEANDLYVIIDLHHYDEIHGDVAGHRDRFLGIWDQIATRYQSAGSKVLFELLNEPNSQFSTNPALLNNLLADGLDVIRETNPTRPVLVGPAQYNSIFRLDDLQLPADDNLIVSVHYYEPFEFTHQGAEWVNNPPAAPASWDADTVGLGAGWQNWSWETTLTPADGGLLAAYDRQWAGVQFARPGQPLDPATLEIEVAGQSQLSVRCGASESNVEVQRIFTVAGGSTQQVNLSACPSNTTLIAFQMASSSYDTLSFRSAEVCAANGECVQLVESAADVLISNLDDAWAWGEANNRPINIGEFGAYGAQGVADLAERAEWTAAVRDAAIERNMSLSYWEFGAGFGVYNRGANAWIQPLLNALDPASVSPPPLVSFTCASNGGVLSWDNDGAPKYWVYRSTDGGLNYSWIGRTIGNPAATTFTDVGAQVGAKYQVHYQGIPRVECSIDSEPDGGEAFACASDGGELSWTDDGASKYWVYRSTDGITYSWIGRTIGNPAPTNFTDAGAQVGAKYQVHYQGLPRVECSIDSEPGGGVGAFTCASDAGELSWTDHDAAKYWVYRSTNGGGTYSWIGRTIGNPAPTNFTDANAQAGARYQVHYQGLPRVECSIDSEPGGGVDPAAHLQSILDNPTRNTIYDDNPYLDVPMNQIQVSDLTVNADLYNEGLLDTSTSGYFRVKCDVSHFAYDDPIIFPNQPGRAHLHMFFGNTEANAYSTFDSLMNTGTGTCNGEDLNRTAYWVPALLDNTGHALIPFEVMVYYKNDNFRLNGANELVEPFPDNLRMVVGNAMATEPQTTLSGGPGSTPIVQFACGPAYNSSYQALIPDCYGLGQGAYGDNGRALEMRISFPQCYDPDAGTYVAGGAHMSYSEGGYYGAACPDSHPYDISSIMYRIFFSPDDYGGSLTDLHLSSDVKTNGTIVAGGTTAHADWFGAWNADAMDLWVENCNNTQADCEIGLLGRDPMISLVPRKRFGYETGYRAPPWELLEMCPTKDFNAGDPLRSVANCLTQ